MDPISQVSHLVERNLPQHFGLAHRLPLLLSFYLPNLVVSECDVNSSRLLQASQAKVHNSVLLSKIQSNRLQRNEHIPSGLDAVLARLFLLDRQRELFRVRDQKQRERSPRASEILFSRAKRAKLED
jgi:hypothetical protein